MSRHSIPNASWSKFCHTHLNLASREHLVNEHLVDVAVVRTFERTHVSNNSVSLCHLLARVACVSCAGIEVELSRVLWVFALEHNVTVARTDVESLLIVEFESLVTSLYNARTADIEHTDFATSSEVRRLQRVDSLKLEGFVHWHSTTHNHTVVHRVNHVNFVCSKNLLNQEVATDALCVITFCIFRMCGITHFIICLHTIKFIWLVILMSISNSALNFSAL